jgi:hypothetical protein
MSSDKIVLICATGRSGSTTIQRILNTIPNSNICGENYGAMNSLLQFYEKLHISSKNYIPGHYKPACYEDIINKNVKPSWYNSYQIIEMEAKIRDIIVAMFKKDSNTNIWGFKEIRYDNNNLNLLKFFKQLFPQTKVIIQIRENIKAQSQSNWHKNDKNAIHYLQKMNEQFYHFYIQNRDWCYFTTFERMFDKDNLQNIFAFIECGENYNEHLVNEVLNNNIKD